MAKILLVEDDNNLREIYEARLQAEGYTIISAKDGEEALVKAKQEKPDLIISDVMMPRISGFEMLDILRNTEGLKEAKVIMLTALGQAEDKTRADALGADRYLVKSQVTLEDIVKAADELLNSGAASAAAPAVTPPVAPTITAMPLATPPSEPRTPPVTPTASATPISAPAPVASGPTSVVPTVAGPAPTPHAVPATPAAPIQAPSTVAQIPVAKPPVETAAAPVISMPANPIAQPPAQPAVAPVASTQTQDGQTPTPRVSSSTVPEPASGTVAPTTPAPTAEQASSTTPAPSEPESPAPEQRPPAELKPNPNPATPAEPAASANPAPAEVKPATIAAASAQPPVKAVGTDEQATNTATENSVVDDKLIEEAVKDLSATLGTVDTAQPSETPTKPVAAAAPTTESHQTAASSTQTTDSPSSEDSPKTPGPAEAPATAEPVKERPETTAPTEQTVATPSSQISTAPELATEPELNEAKPEAANTTQGTATIISPQPAEVAKSAEARSSGSDTEPDLDLSNPNKALDGSTPSVETETNLPEQMTPQTDQKNSDPAPTPPSQQVTSGASSAAEEQALMQAQIEDFINKQGQGEASPTQTPPETNLPEQTTTPTAAQSEQLAEQSGPAPEQPAQSEQPQLATPTPTPTSIFPSTPKTTSPEEPSNSSNQDNVSIAHKKVIQPPVEPIQAKPNLSELLAREGISSLDDEAHTNDEVVAPGNNTPHQPGHVISPNGNMAGPQANSLNPDDPNNIAL